MITIKDHYPVIDQTIQQVKDRFGSDSKIAVMFENCISNTLQTTIKVLDDGSIFVITGDIPAMWLRDSACQLRPFLFFAKEDPEIADIISGLIQKQMQCIQIDPYANAFNECANGNCWEHDKTDMKPELWERKFEIDSLCFLSLLEKYRLYSTLYHGLVKIRKNDYIRISYRTGSRA